ncbi:unnamed protein product [Ilex paraguariensis]|uniref:Uncharacterized protein n=1 Tax=Ilex paraguariensis TaxID=185542 RepID=A0ABC8T4R3_9AQUA
MDSVQILNKIPPKPSDLSQFPTTIPKNSLHPLNPPKSVQFTDSGQHETKTSRQLQDIDQTPSMPSASSTVQHRSTITKNFASLFMKPSFIPPVSAPSSSSHPPMPMITPYSSSPNLSVPMANPSEPMKNPSVPMANTSVPMTNPSMPKANPQISSATMADPRSIEGLSSPVPSASLLSTAKRVVYNNGEPGIYWSLDET